MRDTDCIARRITGFGLTSPDAGRLTEFYGTAFGARYVSSERLTGAGFEGWTPISRGGPQRLPLESGGVTAFKFQDPDGRPLELLAFPEQALPPNWKERSACGIFLGIDHSALSVRDTAVSTAFYQSLGFSVTAQTLNHGVEQANLDGVPNSQVEVTALSLAASSPHLELLCYRSEVRPAREVLSSNDVAATRIALVADGLKSDGDPAQHLFVDPDGHHLLLVL